MNPNKRTVNGKIMMQTMMKKEAGASRAVKEEMENSYQVRTVKMKSIIYLYEGTNIFENLILCCCGFDPNPKDFSSEKNNG